MVEAENEDDVPFPLAQFQGVEATEDGTRSLVKSINKAQENPIQNDRFDKLFAKWWDDLDSELRHVPGDIPGDAPKQRSDRALLEEVLQTVRNLSRGNTPRLQHYAEPNIDIWRGMQVWNVTAEQMAKMSIEDLQDFRRQAYEAWMRTNYPSKEDVIDSKVRLADREISRRKVEGDA